MRIKKESNEFRFSGNEDSDMEMNLEKEEIYHSKDDEEEKKMNIEGDDDSF